MNLNNLSTPAFLIDLAKLRQNTSRMIDRAKSLGIRLRPHVKTHKTIEGTRLQLGGEFDSITVSTLAEAACFASQGFKKQTYAVPIPPQKLETVSRLNRDGAQINILIDSLDAVQAAAQIAESRNCIFGVFLKVDCGYHRAGVNPASDHGIEVARAIHESMRLEFQGILTHAGQSYAASGRDEIKKYAEEERKIMVGFAQRLRNSDIPCKEVSVGSTPTAVQADSLEGITELRPGNYVFFDKYQVDIGNCVLDDCAATVLARVIGRYPETNHFVIDAGALALSKDPGATHITGSVAYGSILGHPNLQLSSLSQEHGIVTSSRKIDFAQIPLGSTIRIVPNHSCLTAALFPSYQIVEDETVVEQWIPVRGW